MVFFNVCSGAFTTSESLLMFLDSLEMFDKEQIKLLRRRWLTPCTNREWQKFLSIYFGTGNLVKCFRLCPERLSEMLSGEYFLLSCAWTALSGRITQTEIVLYYTHSVGDRARANEDSFKLCRIHPVDRIGQVIVQLINNYLKQPEIGG